MSKPTRADQVAEQLKHLILSGAYAPGQKLPPELTLAAELNVNRFTVREAMNQLEQLRLIARKAGAGTVVLDYEKNAGLDVVEYLVLRRDGSINIDVLSNLLELARIVSAEIASLAAERRSEEDVVTLEQVVRTLQAEKNVSQLLWLDFDFNWALAAAARNIAPRLVLNSARSLLNKYSHLLATLWVSPGSISEGYEYVVDAVRARDPERARALVRWIWMGRQQRFQEAVERNSRALDAPARR
ncbi:MAG TPA: GntR family transcriptional regulator [Polyangiaceae bacterium]|nr:GntR family transcriptional regulator [Polyangiaceae bacterium]